MTFTAENPQFTLWGHSVAPNPVKVEIVLRELGLTYKSVAMTLGDGPGGVKSPEFLKINPNGRVPALMDHGNNDHIVWESGAILLYLGRKYDSKLKLWAATLEEQSLIEQWIFFQCSGQGPYMGQLSWFTKYHPEKIESAITRYLNETKRIASVVESQLSLPNSNGWLVLGRMTLADLSFLPWFFSLEKKEISVEKDYPALFSWLEKMKALPGVKALILENSL